MDPPVMLMLPPGTLTEPRIETASLSKVTLPNVLESKGFFEASKPGSRLMVAESAITTSPLAKIAPVKAFLTEVPLNLKLTGV